MESLLAPLLSFLLLYRYVALFVIVYSGAILIPWPVNAMLLAVGAFSSEGYFSFWISLAIAVIANTLGDLTDYGITRKYGEVVIRALRLNRVRFFDQVQEELRTDAAITVFTTRFAGSLSSVTNFLAGLVAVRLKTFFVYDLLGNIIEPFAALFIGYLVGDYWSDFSNLFTLIAAIVAVGIIIFVLLRIHRRITRKYL